MGATVENVAGVEMGAAATVVVEIKALKYFVKLVYIPTYIFYKDNLIIYMCQNDNKTKVLILQLNCKENSVFKNGVTLL